MTPAAPPSPDFISQWQQYAQQLPGALPDNGYDSQRSAFFDKMVRPWAASQGVNSEALREEFLKKTERADKASNPRMNVAGASALRRFVDPMLGLMEGEGPKRAQQKLAEIEAGQAAESQKQGVGSTIPSMVGSAIGAAPYFMPTFRVAGMAGEALGVTSRIARTAEAASAGAAAQGMMDAARAQDGQRVSAGLKGAVIGGATAGVVTGVGLSLFGKGLNKEASDAVDNLVSGTPTAKQEALGRVLVDQDPSLVQDVVESTKASGKAAADLGVPATPPTVSNDPVNVNGITLDNLDTKLQEALDILRPRTTETKRIANLKNVSGTPSEVHRILKAVDDANIQEHSYDAPMTLRGSSEPENALTDSTSSLLAPSATAAPATAKAPSFESAGADFVPQTDTERMAYANWKSGKLSDSEFADILAQPTKSKALKKITIDEVPQYDFLRKQNDGSILDSRTGDSYPTLAEALKAKGAKTYVGSGLPYPEWNSKSRPIAPEASVKFRPQVLRITGDTNLPPEINAYTAVQPKGINPTISYRGEPGQVTSEVAYHEAMHSHLGFLGLNNSWMDQPMWGKLFNAFEPQVQKAYRFLTRGNQSMLKEEVFTWLSQAVRHGDEDLIGRFADADGGKGELLNWYSDTLHTLRSQLATQPENIHKSVLTRKINDLERRATRSLDDLERNATAPLGDRVGFDQNGYSIERLDGSRTVFANRTDLANHLAEHYEPPTIAPELIDTSLLPPGTVRYSIDSKALPSSPAAPIQTTPAEPSVLSDRPSVKAGAELFSFAFRPFYPWMDTVARKHQLPELADAMNGIKSSELQMNAFMDPYRRVLGETLRGYSRGRRQDLFQYLSANDELKPKLETELRITPEEKANLARLDQQFFQPLSDSLGVDGRTFIKEYQPRWKQAGFSLDNLGPTKSDARGGDFEFFSDAVRSGELDPRDRDLMRVAHEYMRLGARKQFLEEPIRQASDFVNQTDQSGNYVLGNLQPLFKRHLDYMRGVPDYTARVMHGVMQGAINTINEGLSGLNKTLPDRMQIEPIETSSRDAFNKWISYSYAGALMLRPMVPIRDSLQILMTTYPVLGGKYLMRGMSEAFPVLRKGGTDTEAFQIPLKYGALMRHNDLLRFLEGEGSAKVSRGVENGMRVLEWSNNSNRLVSFWGHARRIQDALRDGVTDANFAERSGLSYLEKGVRDAYTQEASTLHPASFADFSYRASKDLVDFSQWNYSKGSAPGLYKTAIGRVFGQYGTWPLNYIEYARRLVTGDGTSVAQKATTLTRLALAHGAILKAGEAFGVDTGQWVFTQPMAYGGSPIYQAVVNIPGSMDFESQRGAESRRSVIRPFFPMGIPGGLAAEQIWKAFASDDPDTWKIILGFHPMKGGEENKGIHQYLPGGLNP